MANAKTYSDRASAAYSGVVLKALVAANNCHRPTLSNPGSTWSAV